VLAWSGHDERASIEAIFLDSRRKLFRVCQVSSPPLRKREAESSASARPLFRAGRRADRTCRQTETKGEEKAKPAIVPRDSPPALGHYTHTATRALRHGEWPSLEACLRLGHEGMKFRREHGASQRIITATLGRDGAVPELADALLLVWQ